MKDQTLWTILSPLFFSNRILAKGGLGQSDITWVLMENEGPGQIWRVISDIKGGEFWLN